MNLVPASRAVSAGVVLACLASAIVIAIAVQSVMARLALNTAAEQVRGALAQLERRVEALDEAARALAATGRSEYAGAVRDALQGTAGDRARAIDALAATGAGGSEYLRLHGAIELEVIAQQAVQRVAAQDRDGALELMFGPAEATARQAFQLELTGVRASFEARSGARLAQLTRRARLSGFGAFALLLATVGGVLLALRLFVERRLVRPLATLAERAEQAERTGQDLARGFERNDTELGRLARALEALRRARLDSERERGVRTRIGEIAATLQAADDSAAFARALLSCLAVELPMLCGALFERCADARYRLAGSYGLARDSHRLDGFAPGEGLAGQAVVERRELRLRDLPPSFRQGDGAASALQPALALMLPLGSGQVIVGVLELLLLREPDAEEEQILREVALLLAPRLDVLLRHAPALAALALE